MRVSEAEKKKGIEKQTLRLFHHQKLEKEKQEMQNKTTAATMRKTHIGGGSSGKASD